MKQHLLLLLLSACLIACGAEGGDAPSEGDPAPGATGSEVNTPSGGDGITQPHPGGDPVPMDRLGTSDLSPDRPEPEEGVRNRKRMDLDQLDRALLDATGFRWVQPDTDEPMYEKLASTLGKPDFIQNTLEDLSPSLLFHKFLDDGARFVCTELMAAEAERAPGERIFLMGVDPANPLSDASAIDAALANALLRFHGRHVEPTDPALNVWRWLLENTPSSDEAPLLPWLNVCTGLITHPDFYAY
ncbi:MAG: hypothetical protein ACPGU1_08990 [Myxococcota bacterium]